MEIGMNDYQVRANETAVYPAAIKGNWPEELHSLLRLQYATLGLVGEAGEVANKVKKIIRDCKGFLTREMRTQLADELGDVLWYLAQTCSELDVTLAEVAKHNNAKLKARREAGTIKGSGDGR